MWASIASQMDPAGDLSSLTGFKELNDKHTAQARAAFDRYLETAAKKKAEEEEQHASSVDEDEDDIEDKPKRPASSYMLWRNCQMKSGAWKGVRDSTKQLSAAWRALSASEKRPWQLMFEDAKVEFEQEIKAWMERNPGHEAKERRARKAKQAKLAKKATTSASAQNKKNKKRKTDSDISSDESDSEQLASAMRPTALDEAMDEFDLPQPPPKKKKAKSSPASGVTTDKENESAGSAKKPQPHEKKRKAKLTTPANKSGPGLKLSMSVAKDPWIDFGANGEYDDVVIETQVGCDY